MPSKSAPLAQLALALAAALSDLNDESPPLSQWGRSFPRNHSLHLQDPKGSARQDTSGAARVPEIPLHVRHFAQSWGMQSSWIFAVYANRLVLFGLARRILEKKKYQLAQGDQLAKQTGRKAYQLS